MEFMAPSLSETDPTGPAQWGPGKAWEKPRCLEHDQYRGGRSFRVGLPSYKSSSLELCTSRVEGTVGLMGTMGVGEARHGI